MNLDYSGDFFRDVFRRRQAFFLLQNARSICSTWKWVLRYGRATGWLPDGAVARGVKSTPLDLDDESAEPAATPPKTYLDSEWHAVFYCPFLHTARRKFTLALAASGRNITFRDNLGPARVAAEGAQE